MTIRTDRNAVVLLIAAIINEINCLSPGYSYTKFMGPVSGPEHKISVYDDGMYHQHDYVAKPDYHFAYGVEDPKSKVHQSRHETRHGDTVEGEYSVLDPDGKLRTVKYTADKKNGFQASIITDGHVVHHPQDAPKVPENVPIHVPVYHVPPPQIPHERDDEYSDDNGGEEESGEEENDESEEYQSDSNEDDDDDYY